MKIAILLSGQLRNFKECYESFKMYILDNNDCDIYMQTYLDQEYGEAIKLYKPHRIILEEPHKTFAVHNKCICQRESMYWMHRNTKVVFDLVYQNTYDCILRSRYDIAFTSSLKFNDYDMSKINIPAGGNWLGGINDLMAFSSHENMKYYCSLIDYTNQYITEGIDCHAETLLKHHLKDMLINRFEFDIYLRNHNMTGDSRGRP